MGGSVLLVVDMLNDFARKNGSLYCGESVDGIIPFVVEKVRRFVEAGLPVILIMDSHDPDDLEFQRFPSHCVYGTEGAELIDELKTTLEEYSFAIKVPKSRYSGFYRTNLSTILNDLKPETVEVVGLCTHICVMYTVEELCNRDYNVLVHSRGVCSYDREAHRWALQQMSDILGADVR